MCRKLTISFHLAKFLLTKYMQTASQDIRTNVIFSGCAFQKMFYTIQFTFNEYAIQCVNARNMELRECPQLLFCEAILQTENLKYLFCTGN